MNARRQTLPTITLKYAPDESTGLLTWTLTVSDGDNNAEPVKISPETAAGIAEIVDVGLPLPIVVGGEPTSAERVVRTAHVQTLEAQLLQAQAGLKATTPAHPVTASEQAPADALGKAARQRRAPRARTVADAPVPVAAPQMDDEPPLAHVVPDGEVPLADEPPMVEEAPHFSDLPEHLPRTSHLQVPQVEEF